MEKLPCTYREHRITRILPCSRSCRQNATTGLPHDSAHPGEIIYSFRVVVDTHIYIHTFFFSVINILSVIARPNRRYLWRNSKVGVRLDNGYRRRRAVTGGKKKIPCTGYPTTGAPGFYLIGFEINEKRDALHHARRYNNIWTVVSRWSSGLVVNVHVPERFFKKIVYTFCFKFFFSYRSFFTMMLDRYHGCSSRYRGNSSRCRRRRRRFGRSHFFRVWHPRTRHKMTVVVCSSSSSSSSETSWERKCCMTATKVNWKRKYYTHTFVNT